MQWIVRTSRCFFDQIKLFFARRNSQRVFQLPSDAGHGLRVNQEMNGKEWSLRAAIIICISAAGLIV